MTQLGVPDFELGEAPGGVISRYSDGVPTVSFALVDKTGAVLREHEAERTFYVAPATGVGRLVATASADEDRQAEVPQQTSALGLARLAFKLGRSEAISTGSQDGNYSDSDTGVAHDVTFIELDGQTLCLAACTRGYTAPQGATVFRAISHALLQETNDAPARNPSLSYTLLDSAGNTTDGYGEEHEYYAASTVKLAVAAAVLLRVDAGTLSLEHTLPSTRTYASRLAGSPAFTIGAGEADPGMPTEGAPVSLSWCLERMITHSSNETTNLLTEFIGLGAVDEACKQLGITEVSMTRLICDYAASQADYTHTATTRGLARLVWELTCGEHFSMASREQMLKLLRAQYFPIISAGLPEGTAWGSKSGWDDGIRHDVAVIGEPGGSDFRVLAVCTEGFTPRGAIELITVLTRAIDPTRTRP
ncbi:beta-lactamase class A [Leucobacter exalbidus]|uniref:Beta-lactamase class A n=1 Tax=Leucobacter exalbidus TaxID=662960 RepID=A0A940T3K1_9MICO|nr:serine hydrolase [Leucobacter exalbidus]MBP1325844.1 beta-lactamase class A [Leucobacter exalbidus]